VSWSDERPGLLARHAAARQAEDATRMMTEAERYRELLPTVPLSRCPLTGAAVEINLDTLGLDGLWWDYESPVRRHDDLPSTFLVVAGCVNLGGASTVTYAPFLRKPGPEVPFVVPRILHLEGVRAVLSGLSIGGFSAVATSYFAQRWPDARLINAWGASTYEVREPDGSRGWDHAEDWPPEWDFDLAPWLDGGHVQWIAPGDTSLTLREGSAGCPYLGWQGSREMVRIWGDEVTYPNPMPSWLLDANPNE
jgi:hypothetical protein